MTGRAGSVALLAVVAAGCSLDFDRLRRSADAGGVDAPVERDAGPRDGCVGMGDEVCNGMDDDCDGRMDEDVTRTCSSLCGMGEETCVGGAFGPCDAPEPVDAPAVDVVEDATINADNPTFRHGEQDVMNLHTGPALLKLPSGVDLTSAVQLTFLVPAARCASDCDPPFDCTTATFRAAGTMQLHARDERPWDQASVTWDNAPAEGMLLAQTTYTAGDAVVTLVANMAGEAERSHTFSLRLAEGTARYVVRALELGDGDTESGAMCPPENPPVQLIITSCP